MTARVKEDCWKPLKKREDRGGRWPNCDLLLIINLTKRPAGTRINLTQEITLTVLSELVLSRAKYFLKSQGEVRLQEGRSVDQMLNFEEWDNAKKEKGMAWAWRFSVHCDWLESVIFIRWISYENTYQGHIINVKMALTSVCRAHALWLPFCWRYKPPLCHTSKCLSLYSALGLKSTWKRMRSCFYINKNWYMLIFGMAIYSLSALHWQLRSFFYVDLGKEWANKS